MAIHDPRIEDISRAAEALIAGPPDFLRAFVGEEGGARQIRRSILMASLRDQEFAGACRRLGGRTCRRSRVVLRFRGQPKPDDLRAEIVEVLRQLEGWQAVDGGLAPDRAERDGLRRRVERDYALARSLRVFLPHWDEVQRALRRRYISLSANYFAQAIAALDTLLEELKLRGYRSPALPYGVAIAASGAARHQHRIARLRPRATRAACGWQPPRDAGRYRRPPGHAAREVLPRRGRGRGQGARAAGDCCATSATTARTCASCKWALRQREEEWSVGLGETQDERRERLDAIAHDVERELDNLRALHGRSWARLVARGRRRSSRLALVELTERIHAAISLRLQQTQAITALLRRARDLAEGGERGDAERPAVSLERLGRGPRGALGAGAALRATTACGWSAGWSIAVARHYRW